MTHLLNARRRRRTIPLLVMAALTAPLFVTATAVEAHADEGSPVTVTFSVARGEDDGFVRLPAGPEARCDQLADGTALVDLHGPQLLAGHQGTSTSVAGFRFDVEIPPEATLLDARLRLWNASQTIIRRDEPSIFQVAAVSPDRAAPFSATHTPLHPYCTGDPSSEAFLDSALWDLSGGGAYESPRLDSMIDAYRSAPGWQSGSPVELVMWPIQGQPIKVDTFEGDPARAASLSVTYSMPAPEEPEGTPPAFPGLTGASLGDQGEISVTTVSPWEGYDVWDVWRLRVHAITIVDDHEITGRGDISFSAAMRYGELDPAHSLCPPWVSDTSCTDSEHSLVTWCWPPGTKEAWADIHYEYDHAFRDSRPLPFGVLNVYDPYLHTDCVGQGGTYQMGSGDSMTFDPPLTTEPMLLQHRVGDYDGIFDVIDYEPFETVMRFESELLAEDILGIDEAHLAIGAYVVDGGDFVYDWIGREAWALSYPGNDGATAILPIWTDDPADPSAYIKYSFEVDEIATWDVAWGIYLNELAPGQRLENQGFSARLGGQGWAWANGTITYSADHVKQSPPMLIAVTDAPAWECLPVSVSAVFVGDFGSSCLEPGTYTVRAGDSGIHNIPSVDPDVPSATFTLVKFAVGVPAPTCLGGCPTASILVGEFGTLRWVLVATGLVVVLAGAGLILAGVSSRRRWVGAISGGMAGILAAAILTAIPGSAGASGTPDQVIFASDSEFAEGLSAQLKPLAEAPPSGAAAESTSTTLPDTTAAAVTTTPLPSITGPSRTGTSRPGPATTTAAPKLTVRPPDTTQPPTTIPPTTQPPPTQPPNTTQPPTTQPPTTQPPNTTQPPTTQPPNTTPPPTTQPPTTQPPNTTQPPPTTQPPTTQPPNTTQPPPTTIPRDTAAPKVTGVADTPDIVFTGGTTTITATITDQSKIASVELWYLVGKSWTQYGTMSLIRSQYRVEFGPLSTAGVYQWRILAVDEHGNATCSTRAISGCPGGTTTAIIP